MTDGYATPIAASPARHAFPVFRQRNRRSIQAGIYSQGALRAAHSCTFLLTTHTPTHACCPGSKGPRPILQRSTRCHPADIMKYVHAVMSCVLSTPTPSLKYAIIQDKEESHEAKSGLVHEGKTLLLGMHLCGGWWLRL